MPQYVFLIYTNEAAEAAASPAEQHAAIAEYFAFDRDTREAGALVIGEAFHPTAEAQTVTTGGGVVRVSDGVAVTATPDLQLTGFYILNVADRDAALAWAAKIPGARHGRVEVRALMGFSGFEA